MHPLAFGTRANLEKDRVALGAVDETMRNPTAGLETGGVAGPEQRICARARLRYRLRAITSFMISLVPA
jgi:hypothetical protein